MDVHYPGLLNSWALYVLAPILFLGVTLYARKVWRQLRRFARAPNEWAPTEQELVCVDHHDAWTWLRYSFRDYHVMLKVPLVSYVQLTAHHKTLAQPYVLATLCCDFTVCDAFGVVIGCVDVFDPAVKAGKNEAFKREILEASRIPYVRVMAIRLPSVRYIRAEFIGHVSLSEGYTPADEFLRDGVDGAVNPWMHLPTRPFMDSGM